FIIPSWAHTILYLSCVLNDIHPLNSANRLRFAISALNAPFLEPGRNMDQQIINETPYRRQHSARRRVNLSGEDPNEPVVAYGPFIMNNQEEIADAFDRYRAVKMGLLEAVTLSA